MGLSSSEDRMIVAGVVLAWYRTVTDGRSDERSDGRTVGQTESIMANTALCIAAMLTRCKNVILEIWTWRHVLSASVATLTTLLLLQYQCCNVVEWLQLVQCLWFSVMQKSTVSSRVTSLNQEVIAANYSFNVR